LSNPKQETNKVFSPETLALVLLLSVAFLLLSTDLGKANPYTSYEWTLPPQDAGKPVISVFSPNSSILAKNKTALIFNVSVSKANKIQMLTDIYYETDWQQGNTSVYHLDMTNPSHYLYWIKDFSFNDILTEIPDGNHNVTIIAAAWGAYSEGATMKYFDVSTSLSVSFNVDTVSPSISIATLENKTYVTPDVPLDFTTNEAGSQISYVLDGQANVTLSGNTTLTGLSYGQHNVTMYAVDLAGNVGSSETITFTIVKQESFPTTQLIIASGVSVPLIAVGLMFYFRKRQKQDEAPKL